jgi:hypothetical protein
MQQPLVVKTVYDLYKNLDDTRKFENFPDLRDETFWQIVEICKPHTLLNVDALYNIWEAVQAITVNKLEGALVECGVLLGGSVMAALHFLKQRGDESRDFYLYDTFEGFPEGSEDKDMWGQPVQYKKVEDFEGIVRHNLNSTGYPSNHLRLVRGPVEETLLNPANLPEKIAFLRLDTDYYESTRVELEVLYPRLVSGGLCIIDDYGTFEGARRAADEHLDRLWPRPMLQRVNPYVRAFQKP